MDTDSRFSEIALTTIKSPKAVALPRPISCDSVRLASGHAALMSDVILDGVSKGRGLPAAFYKSHVVPEDFCKPSNGIWKWPSSGHLFFDATDAIYSREHLPAADIMTVERVKKTLPEAERGLVKWMIWPGPYHLWVFELKPYRNAWFFDNSPYVALNYGHTPFPSEFIDAATGYPMAAPPQ